MNDFAINVLTAPIGKTHIFSTGQAGFIIKSASGKLLGIDLYLSDCVERVEGNMGFKRLLPKILSPDEIEFDALIATHFHRDHFDIDSVPRLMANKKTKLFAAEDCRESVDRLEMSEDSITFVQNGDMYSCSDFDIYFVSCDHGAGAPKAVGVVVKVDGKMIYEAGDTCLRLDIVNEIINLGSTDVCIAPINGAYGNMNEKECARYADALKAGITVPCHYGMFASHGGDPGLFYEIMKKNYPENDFCILAQGERLTI